MISLRSAALDRLPAPGGRIQNQHLADALERTGWSPRELVRTLNPRLDAIGEPALHLTAGRSWLNGAQPRSETVRRLVATVITEATGDTYTTADLWGHEQRPSHREKTATDDLLGRRSLTEILATATAWTATEPREQAVLHPATDTTLFSAVWDATRQAPLHTFPGSGPDEVIPPFMDALEGHLRQLRRLDDTAGGGALPQRYVRGELAGVLELVRNSRYSTDIGTRLLITASGMAQLAGWMAFDADLNAAAQRYQLLAIRLARSAGDTHAVANVLGMLSYQHAACAKPAAALRFAEAAVDHTARSLPIVRARAWGRLATAYAVAGDTDAFRNATERCHLLLQHRRDDDPPALYYFTPEQVAAETGHALVELAAANPGHARRLLAEATEHLSPLADNGPTSGFQRSALLHGIHLARAHLLAHDTETTLHTLLRLADHVPHVQSIRCRSLLRRIRRQAGTHIHSPDGADALAMVDRALSVS
ncbi:hypothetical protein ACGFWD_40280 [Streptomyces sp. NPDC048448]|uniref:hypothetical protein n=1 Tax=unclassified Streptomyces TaxID=2593676 RepID=UPI002E33BD46|nr:hypothetical protein [Streptomyces sp. NBC_01462]